MLHIVLVAPEIPANTGNISRTCAATGTQLHLIKPLGFSLEDKYLKRAGLDYWSELQLTVHDSLDTLIASFPGMPFYYATTKARKTYTEMNYQTAPDVFLVFGRETAGLPEELLLKNQERCIRIPIREEMRSLNLSNSVAIVLYEALRQNDFLDLSTTGNLARLSWDGL